MLFNAIIGFAQENNLSSFSIQTDSLFFAENESLASLTIILKNDNQTPFTGRITINTIDGIALIGQEKSSIQIDAHSRLYYPIRLSIGKGVSAGNTLVLLQLLDDNDSVKAQFTSKLVVQPKRQVQLINNSPAELMQNVGDSLVVSAVLSNRGNSEELITVTASFPNLKGGNHVDSKQVFIKAFQDTIITFKKIITKELLSVERYTVNMAALYENGELINNIMVGVQNVSGNRTYADPFHGYNLDLYNNNRISLSGRNLFTDNESMQLNARGVFSLPKGSLNFNVDGERYTQMANRTYLSNTFLDYNYTNKGITVGNISENLETFLNGRGIKVYLGNEENSKMIEAGIVDKTYNLLGDEYKLTGGNGYTMYAKTSFNNQTNQQYSASILYDRTPYNNSENVILMNEYQYKLKNDFQVGFEFGGGLARVLGFAPSSFKPSIAIGNKLNGALGKYNFTSNNFFSSGYYPGIRRGVLQLNERISRNFNQVNTWASYSYYNYDPKYPQAQSFNFSSSVSNSRIETGTYFPLSSTITFAFSAKQHSDQGRFYDYQNDINPLLKMSSFRLTESVNWRSQDNQHLVYLSSENGFSKSPITGDRQFQLRANATWNYSFLFLNGFFQKGDFNVIEAYNNAKREREVYRFNASAGIRKEYFDNKLKTHLDVNYNKDSYSGSNWMFSGLVDYAFSPLFSAFVNTYLYTYTSSYFASSYSNVQAGISYVLPNSTKGATQKKGNINLFLFYDNNANGVFDEGDIAAEGRIVMIGGMSFITQSDGSIRYKKVPYGQYALGFPSQNWYADAPTQLSVQNQDLTLNIPLKKTSKIVGSLYYNYDQQTSEEVFEKHGGLRLMLKDKKGSNSQVLTNANGEFAFFVPVGGYEFWIDETSLPNNVYTEFQPQKLNVMEGVPLDIQPIELKVKQKQVEIKRFTSD